MFYKFCRLFSSYFNIFKTTKCATVDKTDFYFKALFIVNTLRYHPIDGNFLRTRLWIWIIVPTHFLNTGWFCSTSGDWFRWSWTGLNRWFDLWCCKNRAKDNVLSLPLKLTPLSRCLLNTYPRYWMILVWSGNYRKEHFESLQFSHDLFV